MKHTILVTGSSRGIGAEIARGFALDGHRVCIQYCHGRDQAEALCASLREAHLSAMTAQGDLADAASIEALVASVRARYGPIDVLINNAGIALPQMLLTDCGSQDWDRVFAVNTRGMYLVTKAVLPDMIRKKWGSIVNISSMWGVTGGACEVPYSASKAAVIGFTKSLAKEVAPSGVRVNCVAPGFIQTEMNAALSADAVAGITEETPLLRAGTPEDIAAAARFLALEDASFITGQVLSVDGGRCI